VVEDSLIPAAQKPEYQRENESTYNQRPNQENGKNKKDTDNLFIYIVAVDGHPDKSNGENSARDKKSDLRILVNFTEFHRLLFWFQLNAASLLYSIKRSVMAVNNS